MKNSIQSFSRQSVGLPVQKQSSCGATETGFNRHKLLAIGVCAALIGCLPYASALAAPLGFYTGLSVGPSFTSYKFSAPYANFHAGHTTGKNVLVDRGAQTDTIVNSTISFSVGYQRIVLDNFLLGGELQINKSFFPLKESFQNSDDYAMEKSNYQIDNIFSAASYITFGKLFNNNAFLLAKAGAAVSYDKVEGSTGYQSTFVDGNFAAQYSDKVFLYGPALSIEAGYPLSNNLYLTGSYTWQYFFNRSIGGVNVSENPTGRATENNSRPTLEHMNNNFNIGIKYFF
jgi:hypothetical protein